MSKKAKVIFCNCGYSNIIDSSLKAQVLNALEAAAVDFEAVQDLCEMAAGKNPKLKCWAQAESLKIVACYSRAVKWLFNAADAPLDPDKTQFQILEPVLPKKSSYRCLEKKLPSIISRNSS